MTKTSDTDTIISEWAFVTLVSNHLNEAMKEGKFGMIQELLKESGYHVTLRKKQGEKPRGSISQPVPQNEGSTD